MSTPEAERFAIIPLYQQQPAPSNAIAHGSMSAVMERIVDSNVRNDAIDLIHEAAEALGQLEATRDQEEQIQARGLEILNASIDQLTRRLDQLQERREAQTRADEEAEAKAIQDYLNSLPDPDDPAETHHPGGELHDVGPSEPARAQQLETTDAGPVPLSYGKLPLSYVKGEDAEGDLPAELTEKVPVDPGTEPNLSGAREPTTRNPVGISW